MKEHIGAINEVDERHIAEVLKAGIGHIPQEALLDCPPFFEIDLELDSGEIYKHAFRFDINWDVVQGGRGNMLVERPHVEMASSSVFCELLDLAPDYIENGTLFRHDHKISPERIEGQQIGVIIGYEIPGGFWSKGRLYKGERVIKGFYPAMQASTMPVPD